LAKKIPLLGLAALVINIRWQSVRKFRQIGAAAAVLPDALQKFKE
jgi:hypothetical protein